MGKSTPSPPAAPDPTVTSAAQTKSNQQTALYNFGLSNPNVNTPLGSMTYNVDTSNPNAPVSTQNITLSPQQQQLYNQQTQQSIGLSDLANQLQGNVNTALASPTPTYANLEDASQKASNAYYNQQTAYLDPQYQQGQEQLNNQLANQGLAPGTQAYQNAEDQFNRNKTFAYNQAQQNAILQGPQNAQALFGLDVAAQNQPLNELNALRSGSQVSMPQFQNTTPSQAQPTNVLGAYNTAYQGALNSYDQQVAQQNSTMGGLFGLGGSALGAYGTYAGLAAMSDIRLKENITHIGYENGFPIYTFSYRSDPAKAIYRGVMAQDVLRTHPEAVVDVGDYYAVNYHMIGIEFGRMH